MTDPFALNSAAGANPATAAEGNVSSDLVTERGSTVIADAVVAKIAGMAAGEVSGVHNLGSSPHRSGVLRDRIPAPRPAGQPGITVEVANTKATIQVGIIAEYGVALHALAEAIRRNVIVSVERMTGLQVAAVNVHIHDIFLDGDAGEAAEA